MKSESAPLLVLSTLITQESSTLERFLQSTPICLSFGYHPKMSKRPSGIVFQTKAARFLGKQILCRKVLVGIYTAQSPSTKGEEYTSIL